MRNNRLKKHTGERMQNPTLLCIAQARGNQKNVVYTQDLAKKSGILKTMWWQKSNAGLKHNYQKAASLPGGEFRMINDGVVPSDITTESGTIDLMALEALHQSDRDIVDKYPGGLKQYIADKSPGYLYGLGKTFSKQLIYGTDADNAGFTGLRQVAIDNENVLSTGSTDNSYDHASILAVRWAVDECTGLYDDVMMNESLIKIDKSNGGKWFYKSMGGKEYPVYQFSYHGFFGLEVLSKSNVGLIRGVRENDFNPKADQIDQLLENILAETDGSTFLYMNRKTRRLLSKLKNEKLQLTAYDTDFGLMLDTWNGIPIIIEDNMTSTELSE